MKCRDLQIGDLVSIHSRSFKKIVSIKKYTNMVEFILEDERRRHRLHKMYNLEVSTDRILSGKGFM